MYSVSIFVCFIKHSGQVSNCSSVLHFFIFYPKDRQWSKLNWWIKQCEAFLNVRKSTLMFSHVAPYHAEATISPHPSSQLACTPMLEAQQDLNSYKMCGRRISTKAIINIILWVVFTSLYLLAADRCEPFARAVVKWLSYLLAMVHTHTCACTWATVLCWSPPFPTTPQLRKWTLIPGKHSGGQT